MAPFDGPALTLDGRVLELDGGFASYFDHEKERSPSHAAKHDAKDTVRMLQAMEVAHAACEGEQRIVGGEACSVDATGALHGAAPPVSPDDKRAAAARLKLFHSKRSARHTGDFDDLETHGFGRQISIDSDGVAHPKDGECDDLETFGFGRQISIDSDGVARPTDVAQQPSHSPKGMSPDRLKRFHKKRFSRARSTSEDEEKIISVDTRGVVRDCWQPEPFIVPAAICAF